MLLFSNRLRSVAALVLTAIFFFSAARSLAQDVSTSKASADDVSVAADGTSDGNAGGGITKNESAPDIPYGGHHEFGILGTYSGTNGPTFGYDRNTRYATALLRYSYQLTHRPFFTVRYTPEITAVAMLYDRAPSCCYPGAPKQHLGAGINVVSFQGVFFSRDRIQPFISESGGVLYYADRVLSPQGSQFMFTIDYGAGVNYFITRRNAATLGFRYQHQSNADTTVRNPGTDAMELTLGFSHFHTKGVR